MDALYEDWSDLSESGSSDVGIHPYDADYEEQKERLFKALKKCEGGTGDFACGGNLPKLPYPGLYINGVGIVALPVMKDQAEKIMAVAKKSPYGLGEKTILDESFRKSWQLEPSQIKIMNEEFSEGVKALARDIKKVLGCNDKSVRTVFYKVLLYEKGGHFKPHRDTEKAKGMFATLVVQLPSVFEGGKLVVRHAGVEKEIQMDGDQAAFFCKYSAHYSDCEHELTEIRNGYRLALVYSLCWNAVSEAPSPYAGLSAARNLSKILTDFCDARDGEKLVWCLSHKYTESALKGGMKSPVFKGKDAGLISALDTANKLLPDEDQFELYVTQVTRHRVQHGDFDGRFVGCGDEEEHIRVGTTWFKFDGSIKEMPRFKLNVEDEALNYSCPEGTEEEQYKQKFWGKPDKKDNTGPSGNEGASEFYWYRHFAIIAWKKKHTLKFMCCAEVESVIAAVMKEVKLAKGMDSCQPTYQKALANVKQIISFATTEVVQKDSLEDKVVCPLLEMLSEIGDVALAQSFLTGILGKEVSFDEEYSTERVYGLGNDQMIPKLVHLIKVLGWKSVSSSLIALFEKCPVSQFKRWISLVDQLVGKSGMTRKELINFKTKCIDHLYSSLGSGQWKAMQKSEQMDSLIKLQQIQAKHPKFDDIFNKFINHDAIKKDVEIICNLITHLERNCENKLQIHDYIRTLVVLLVEETELRARTGKLSSLDVTQSVIKTAQALFLVGKPVLLQRFVNAVLLTSSAELLKVLLKNTNSSLQKEDPHWLMLVNARVQQLEVLEKQGPIPDDWCQENARYPELPQVEAFLHGPRESWVSFEFSSIKQARDWVGRYFSPMWHNNFTVEAVGSGRGSYVIITKTSKTQRSGIPRYQANMLELKELRPLLKRKYANANSTEPPLKKPARNPNQAVVEM